MLPMLLNVVLDPACTAGSDALTLPTGVIIRYMTTCAPPDLGLVRHLRPNCTL